MVVGAFPAAKLGALLLRQISKPIANYIKEQAKSSPIFRTYVCMPPAQFYNWCEVKTKMWVLNLGKPVNIPVLNEAMAIELGANLLGEAIIFVIASGILISEYTRSYRKEVAKEAAKQDEIDSLNSELKELFFVVEEQRVQIRELLRTVTELDSYAIKIPHWSQRDDNNKTSEVPTPPSPPPPPASTPLPPSTPSPVLSLPPANDADKGIKIGVSLQVEDNSSSNLLLHAVEIVEKDFLTNREQGINLGVLSVALNYIYNDIYKVPLRMYQ